MPQRSSVLSPVPSSPSFAKHLTEAFRRLTFPRAITTELQLQDILEVQLRGMKMRFRREKKLTPLPDELRQGPGLPRSGERIDFLVSRVGVEVKIEGGVMEVMRQLLRYSNSPDVDSLILVTTRASLSEMPREIGGKPLHVAVLFGALL